MKATRRSNGRIDYPMLFGRATHGCPTKGMISPSATLQTNMIHTLKYILC